MGIITLEKANHLFWLGRYAERMTGTIHMFMDCYDKLIDIDPDAYIPFCENLSIPTDCYKDADDFAEKFVYDTENPDSIVCCIRHAYDNAVELREDITSDTLAYIELIKAILEKKEHGVLMLELQKVLDYINAFWGCAADQVDEACKNIIKAGKHAEKLDIEYRFHITGEQRDKEMAKLKYRMSVMEEKYNIRGLKNVIQLFQKEDCSDWEIISMITSLTNCFEDWLDE